MAVIRPTFAIIRAVGALFARRMLRPILIISLIVLVFLHAAGTYAVFQNVWWWLLEALLILVSLVFVILFSLLLLVLRFVEPRQSNEQKAAVTNFVEKFERVAEGIKTPMPVVVAYIVRDTIWPRTGGFIETISEDSRTLAPDFAKLKDTFEKT